MCPFPPPKPRLLVSSPHLLGRVRMPFFLIFLACLISALVLRSADVMVRIFYLNVKRRSLKMTGVILMANPGSSRCVTCGAVDRLTTRRRRSWCCRLKRKRFNPYIYSFLGPISLENTVPELHDKGSLSQVSITVIGSDSRKAAAESAFENCRLVVDASVYIWLFLSSRQPIDLPVISKEQTVILANGLLNVCVMALYTDQFHLCVKFSVHNSKVLN